MSVRRDEMARRLGIDPFTNDRVDALNRRDFVKLLAASAALAGIDGCTRMPASNIWPYVNQPELTPGNPQYYATSMVLDGCATGLLVESHEGRPTKIEGNPAHPASLGGTGVHEQASVLQLYDPHRTREIQHDKRPATWNDLAAALSPKVLRSQVGARGEGLFLIMEPTSSPLEAELLQQLSDVYPAASVHFHAPVALLNEPQVPQFNLPDADIILAVDADFLADGPFHLRHARHFSERRRPESSRAMNRLYVIESSVTVTGMAADHRFVVRPSELTSILEHLLAMVSAQGSSSVASTTQPSWITSLARDLQAHRGRSVVIAGRYLPGHLKTLALQINDALGNIDRTIWLTRSPLVGAGNERQLLPALVEALRAGQVDTLICTGGNPSYTTPAQHSLGTLIRKVRQSVYLGLYDNETARDCKWIIPDAHYLESWGDARAYDGTLSIVQPLIEPISAGRTTSELLSVLLGNATARSYDLLRNSWRTRGLVGTGVAFEDGWRTVLGRGLLDGSAFPRERAAPVPALEERARQESPIELIFRPHPTVHDGSFANNAWLQELPDPVTTLTWENAVQLSPTTAERIGVTTGDLVDVGSGHRQLEGPALIVPGHADECVTLHFGYGRDGNESIARHLGVNVFALWPGDQFTAAGTLSRSPGATHRDLAITQPHHVLQETTPARATTLDRYPQRPSLSKRHLTLYEPPVDLPDPPSPQQWAMTIDLGTCIGCGACMVACQAENNVPVVGRDDVLRGREMHWLRIDWYGSAANEPASLPQPMLCQHCEKAPCEYVCPVEATVHSRDGLNEMIYNRCVGTRFCSNNCPYKVRRFNWFDYNAGLTDLEELAKNPDVTVRERGVMEKCTFCVQRIREAEIAARIEHRSVADGDVRTACQQACPTRAIVFGSLTDPDGQIARERTSPRIYAVLDDLGTEPRVRYLARVRNTNPDLGS